MYKKFKIIFIIIFFFNFFNNIWAQTVFCPNGTVVTSGLINCDNTPYKLVFQDEFDGEFIDTSKWYTFYPRWPQNDDLWEYGRTHGNNEDQVYKDQNVIIEDSKLKLRAKKQTAYWFSATKNFTSGMLYSKSNFIYGKYEIRCKLPCEQGFWPAFWLWGHDELDVFEYCTNNPNILNTNLHMDCDNHHYQMNKSITSVNSCLDYHIYSVEWDYFYVKWYIDGELVRIVSRYTNMLGNLMVCGANLPLAPYVRNDLIPDQFMHIIANLAVNNNDPNSFCKGDSPSNTISISDMDIDYIRIWQRQPQQGFDDLCSSRKFIGNNEICENEVEEFKVEGGHGDLKWSTSNNLEIIENGPNYIKVKSKYNSNSQIGEIYLNEINSPCGVNYNIVHKINIGVPKLISVSKNVGDCNNPITFFTSFLPGVLTDYICTINGINITPFAFNNNSIYWGIYNPPQDNFCYELEISAINNCGAYTFKTIIRDNCGLITPCLVNQYDEISDFDIFDKISLFPNPTQDYINISFDDKTDFFVKELKIISAISSNEVLKIVKFNLSEKLQINISALPKGVYFVQFLLDDYNPFYKTFIKN